MKAIVHGHRGNLSWTDVPDVSPGPGQVRIRVSATAVNRADLLQARGKYPPPAGTTDTIGLECSGIVDSLGDGVTAWAVGDQVCALLAGGGYAEHVVVPVGQVMRIPAGISMEQAAVLPEVFATAYLNLFWEGALQPGERVLVHAGASGVGTAVVQLCRALGNECWVTVGSDAKVARCVALGASGGTNRHTGDFLNDIKDWTDGEGVSVIIDPVGGGYFLKNQRILAVDGRWVVIGLMQGRKGELDLGRMLVKRHRIVGSTLRTRSEALKADLCQRLVASVWPRIASGMIKPVVDSVFSIEHAEKAFERIRSNETVGKVILRVT